MIFIYIFALFTFIGWLIGKFIGSLFFNAKTSEPDSNDSEKIVIHNHITENHLHITEDQIKSISGKINTQQHFHHH